MGCPCITLGKTKKERNKQKKPVSEMIQMKFINIDACIQFHSVVSAVLLLVIPAALISSPCDYSQHSLEKCRRVQLHGQLLGKSRSQGQHRWTQIKKRPSLGCRHRRILK